MNRNDGDGAVRFGVNGSRLSVWKGCEMELRNEYSVVSLNERSYNQGDRRSWINPSGSILAFRFVRRSHVSERDDVWRVQGKCI